MPLGEKFLVDQQLFDRHTGLQVGDATRKSLCDKIYRNFHIGDVYAERLRFRVVVRPRTQGCVYHKFALFELPNCSQIR